jgi:O-antigen ligase/polysaccharide polymerase Wzy-like membrane protein
MSRRSHRDRSQTAADTLATVSSVAPAPKRAVSRPDDDDPTGRLRWPGTSIDAAVGALLAAGFLLVAFLTTGGTDLGPNTWVEVALVLVGAALAAAVTVFGAPGRAWGGITLLLFAALAGLTYASIAWSVQPENSWIEANRTLSYLAAFGAAIALARIFPARWPALLGAVAAAATGVCAYALLVKVFPATLDPTDLVGRLKAPFAYWNATGLIAALGVPVCIWGGARPARGRILRALSIPALSILLAVLVLSYSRGALIAVIVACAVWFVLAPMRLRAAFVLGLGAVGGAILTIWALAHHPLTHDHIALAARTHAGHIFGLVVLVVAAAMTLVGVAATYALDRVVVPDRTRRRIATALLVCVALAPVAGLAAVANSSRGLPGEVSHLWHSLTNTNGVVTESPGRLAELSNSRPRYWREGLRVGEHALVAGTGAGGFLTARTHYSSDPLVAGHAHSYVIETFADFGLIGTLLSLALLVAWIVACGRTLGLWPGGLRAPPEETQRAEHAGLVTMLAVTVVFGIHSAIDWTWFFPGVTIPALACAGWLAGRGPLSDPVGRGAAKRLTKSPSAAGIVLAIVAIAVGAVWVVWQPLRSSNADASAVTELLAGRTDAALTDAQTAVSADPVSVDALWELSEIHVATGDVSAARVDLVRATDRQPSNPETWQRLGEFDLRYKHLQRAVPELTKAVGLDLTAVQPLWDLSAAYITLHNLVAARAALAEATVRQPRDPQAFLALGQFDLRFHAPQAAVPELQTALALGAPATQANRLLANAEAALNAQHARAAAAAKAAARRRSGH